MFERVIVPQPWHNATPIIYGYSLCDGSQFFGPHVRPYYLFHYILKGQGYYQYGDKKINVKKDDMFIIHPDEVTTYFADKEDPYEYSWIGIQITEELDFLEPHVLSNPPCRYYFEQIRFQFTQTNLGNEDIDKNIFFISHQVLECLSKLSEKENSSYADYVKIFLENNYMQDISIEKLSNDLHIDRHYMCQLFNKKYGIPPKTFLIQTRLYKAQELLRQGKRPTEVCRMVGFSDFANFSKKYKKMFAVAPGQEVRQTDIR